MANNSSKKKGGSPKPAANPDLEVIVTAGDDDAPPPPPGTDTQVDPADLIMADGGDQKSLGALAAADANAAEKNLLSLIGADDKTATIINDAIAKQQSDNEHVRNVLDQSVDDITRAKSVEAMAAFDMMKGSVVADALFAKELEVGDGFRALDAMEKKARIRLGLFDAIGRRKRLELDDVTSHRRHIIQQTINQVVEDLEKTLTEEGVEADQVSKILQRLADKVAIRFGEDSDGGE